VRVRVRVQLNAAPPNLPFHPAACSVAPRLPLQRRQGCLWDARRLRCITASLLVGVVVLLVAVGVAASPRSSHSTCTTCDGAARTLADSINVDALMRTLSDLQTVAMQNNDSR
jgi:hypothetical protein